MCKTLVLVTGLTPGLSCRARCTVPIEMPSAFAISRRVVGCLAMSCSNFCPPQTATANQDRKQPGTDGCTAGLTVNVYAPPCKWGRHLAATVRKPRTDQPQGGVIGITDRAENFGA